jgi:hypothetical protein
MGLTIASNLLNSALGTKVSIFGYPLYIPNLHWFYYLAHKDLIPKWGGRGGGGAWADYVCVCLFIRIIVTCYILLTSIDVGA